MQIHRSLFLAAGLSFAACSSTGFLGTQSAQSESNLLTVHVVESSGGG